MLFLLTFRGTRPAILVNSQCELVTLAFDSLRSKRYVSAPVTQLLDDIYHALPIRRITFKAIRDGIRKIETHHALAQRCFSFSPGSLSHDGRRICDDAVRSIKAPSPCLSLEFLGDEECPSRARQVLLSSANNYSDPQP